MKTYRVDKKHFPLFFIIVAVIVILLSGFFLLKNKNKGTGSTKIEGVLNVNPQNPADQKKLNVCLTDAYKKFIEEWNNNCKKSGINNHLPNCNLPPTLSESINKNWTDLKNKCYRGN